MRAIHVCLANFPPGALTLVDLLDWLSAGFAEHGIRLTTSPNQFRGDVPNLIVEANNSGFKRFLDAHFGRLKVICVVTEVILPDESGFDVNDPELGRLRFEQFLSLRDHYAGFITTAESNVPILRRIAPTTYFEFGYSDRLLSLSTPGEWEFEFSFTGNMSRYRRDFLVAAANKVNIVAPGLTDRTHSLLAPQEYLGLIRRTAINLCLRQHAAWTLPSQTRLGRILHSAVGCAMEHCTHQTRQSAIVPPANRFVGVEDFLETFAAADRVKVHEHALALLSEYRAKLPLRLELFRNFDECPALLA